MLLEKRDFTGMSRIQGAPEKKLVIHHPQAAHFGK
jgi:hypothetical protein